jgi:hypothetical protein
VCTNMCAFDAMGTHRENGAGSVYFDHKAGTRCRDSRYHRNCTGRWSASLSVGLDGGGKRIRKRVTASTKTGLLEKLKELQKASETGLDVSGSYTVGQCLDDFLAAGLDGLAPSTVELYGHLSKLLKALLGAYKLRDLTSVQVQAALRSIAEEHTSRTVSLCRNVLERAIRFAQEWRPVLPALPRLLASLRVREIPGPGGLPGSCRPVRGVRTVYRQGLYLAGR